MKIIIFPVADYRTSLKVVQAALTLHETTHLLKSHFEDITSGSTAILENCDIYMKLVERLIRLLGFTYGAATPESERLRESVSAIFTTVEEAPLKAYEIVRLLVKTAVKARM